MCVLPKSLRKAKEEMWEQSKMAWNLLESGMEPSRTWHRTGQTIFLLIVCFSVVKILKTTILELPELTKDRMKTSTLLSRNSVRLEILFLKIAAQRGNKEEMGKNGNNLWQISPQTKENSMHSSEESQEHLILNLRPQSYRHRQGWSRLRHMGPFKRPPAGH